MAKIDKIKEKINYLKVWLGIFVVTNISLTSWLVNNYEKETIFKLFADIFAILFLTYMIVLVHKTIIKKIDELEEL